MKQLPDEKLFYDDLQSKKYQDGVDAGLWELYVPDSSKERIVWPRVCFGINTNHRSLKIYYIMINAKEYPIYPPTGSFWDINLQSYLDKSMFPKTKDGSYASRIFRIDWPPEPKRAFYHFFDRYFIETHSNLGEFSDQMWTKKHTIADYLTFFHGLLSECEND